MATFWYFLLWGLTLIQNISSLDVEVDDGDDFEEFEDLHNSSYRLPTTTKPRLYELTLTPYFDIVPQQNIAPFSFDGEVFIHMSPTQENVRKIVLHCNDLTIHTLSIELDGMPVSLITDRYECEMPYDFLNIETAEDLQLNNEYVIQITFTGNIQSDMRGFYRSWYKDETGERRWIGTTQFQPGHARRAFPCYDEPGFKSFFDLTIIRQPNYSPSISNMPIRTTSQTLDGRFAETFYRTPLMSTYLLAFVVSDFVLVSTNNNPSRPFETYARSNSGSTSDWSLEIGELLLAAMEQYTRYPYYTVADNMNMKQVAVPDFPSSAMENWGLIIYREPVLLYDPENSNHFYKQRIANLVSHEITHMWFGNLVTCAWWDNLWLNEGFARFFQFFITDTVAPELGYDTRFIVEQVHLAMFEDSVNSAHPLTNDVSDPDSVWAHFSVITYAKGAAVLRMTQHLLGESTFRRGLRMYLAAREFNVAEPEHLFNALDLAAVIDRSLRNYNDLTIASFLKSWSEEAGYPLLQVTINQSTGWMTLFQRRWEREIGISVIMNTWPIPITWTRANAANFQDLKPSSILNDTVGLLNRGTTDLEWVIFNKQQSGFYRVDYDETNWVLLTRTLRSDNRTIIHEYNRAQIVDDLFAFARTGRKTYTRLFNILSFLEFEDAYAPWIAAIGGFNFVRRRLAHDSTNLQKLQDEIIRLSVAVTNRLGYSEIEGEPFMDGLLRMYLLTFLCNIEHPQCKEAARAHFESWKRGEYLPPNIRPWVYCSGLRQGTADDFDYFWNRYENENLANEKLVMLEAAGCTTDHDSLEKFLDAIIAVDDTVRLQDKTTAFNSAISGNEVNTLRFFDWLKANLQPAINVYGSIATPVGYITNRLNNIQDIDEFSGWLEENRESIGTSAYNTGVSGVTTARIYMAWHLLRVSEFETYFENGYVEDVLQEEIVDEEIDEVEGEDDNSEVPDSSNILHFNIAILSLVVLLYLL